MGTMSDSCTIPTFSILEDALSFGPVARWYVTCDNRLFRSLLLTVRSTPYGGSTFGPPASLRKLAGPLALAGMLLKYGAVSGKYPACTAAASQRRHRALIALILADQAT